MEHSEQEKFYSLRDLNVAFNMGLESAVSVLEKAETLSPHGRVRLAQALRESILRFERLFGQPGPRN